MMLSVEFAGTKFFYRPLNVDNSYGRVHAAGPTLQKVTVYVVNEGEKNPGIFYSYSLPKSAGEFAHSKTDTASGTDGTGVTDSDVSKQKTAIKPSNIQVSISHVPSVRNSYIHTNLQVQSHRATSLYDTKRYSLRIDENIEKKQQYVYQNAIQVLGGKTSIMDNVYRAQENDRTGESISKPENSLNYIANEIRYRGNWRDDNEEQIGLESRGSRISSRVYGNDRYMWSHGQWTECSSKCGSGYQRRIVSCVDRERREAVDQEYCNIHLQPSDSRQCRNDNCQSESASSYIRWQVGDWGTCSQSCELGDQVQQVYCEAVFDDNTTIHVDDERCLNQYSQKPQYRRSCNDGVSCDQGHMWMFSKWSQCSVTCGPGFQQRSVTCRSKAGHHQVVTPRACNADIKPVAMRRCDMGACPPEIQQQKPDGVQDCWNTYYGCCLDGITPAKGENQEGCFLENFDQKLVRVGGRQILKCAKLLEQDHTYILEWMKHGQAHPVYKQYRWKWESYRTSLPEVNPNFVGRVRIIDETSLEISQAQKSDSGLYTCTLLLPQNQSDSRHYRNQVFLDVRGQSGSN